MHIRMTRRTGPTPVLVEASATRSTANNSSCADQGTTPWHTRRPASTAPGQVRENQRLAIRSAWESTSRSTSPDGHRLAASASRSSQPRAGFNFKLNKMIVQLQAARLPGAGWPDCALHADACLDRQRRHSRRRQEGHTVSFCIFKGAANLNPRCTAMGYTVPSFIPLADGAGACRRHRSGCA